MTWEEIIIQIRKQPEFSELVEKAYLDADLVLNINRFKSSDEYSETKKIISSHFASFPAKKILDIGSGNGISAVSFALDGYEVTAVEPDKSETVGSGAIRWLKERHHLSNLSVLDSFGEELPFQDNWFDMVYIRQAMHHARDLKKFISEAARVLKKGGLFLTIRDHVVYNEKDKQWFLENHVLQKFYGGENAFTLKEYKSAMKSAGIEIKKVLKYFDSPINYFPEKKETVTAKTKSRDEWMRASLRKKLPSFLSSRKLIAGLYSRYINYKLGEAVNENEIPGRMYSFIAVKPL